MARAGGRGSRPRSRARRRAPAGERFEEPSRVEGRFAVLQSVVDETRALFHRLRVAAELLHGLGEMTAGRRGVLLDLARQGPLTVPALARLRPVSRQHIQALVNPMLEEGLVDMAANPAHRRSRLVRLTSRGAREVEAMLGRERAFLARLDPGAPEADLRRVAQVLRGLRAALEQAPSHGRPPRTPGRGR